MNMRVFNGMVIYPAPCPIELSPPFVSSVPLFLSPIQPQELFNFIYSILLPLSS